MDPNEAWRTIVGSRDRDARIDACAALADWLDGGGFAPNHHIDGAPIDPICVTVARGYDPTMPVECQPYLVRIERTLATRCYRDDQ